MSITDRFLTTAAATLADLLIDLGALGLATDTGDGLALNEGVSLIGPFRPIETPAQYDEAGVLTAPETYYDGYRACLRVRDADTLAALDAADDATAPHGTRLAELGDPAWGQHQFAGGLPVPAEVGPAQIRVAMRAAGVDPALVDTAIEGIADPIEQANAHDLWHKASTIKRDHPLIAALAAQLQLTTEQVDGIFIAAAAI